MTTSRHTGTADPAGAADSTDSTDSTGPAGPPARPKREGRPQYTGLTTYQDPLGRFEFKHASDWVRDELADDREGVIFLFERGVTDSYFAAWVTDLGERVRNSDRDTLVSGFDAGLGQLPDLRVEHQEEDVFGHIVRLERRYTFRENGETRKRRVRAVYADQWQILLVFQGATEDEYAYWEPMGNFAFARFDLAQALWYLTDPELEAEREAQERAWPADPANTADTADSADTADLADPADSADTAESGGARERSDGDGP